MLFDVIGWEIGRSRADSEFADWPRPMASSRGQMKKGGSLPDSRVAEQFS